MHKRASRLLFRFSPVSLSPYVTYVSGDFWVSQYGPALRALLSRVDLLCKPVFFSS